jgi:hypothetical protein
VPSAEADSLVRRTIPALPCGATLFRRLKPALGGFGGEFAARLKPCPDTNRRTSQAAAGCSSEGAARQTVCTDNKHLAWRLGA